MHPQTRHLRGLTRSNLDTALRLLDESHAALRHKTGRLAKAREDLREADRVVKDGDARLAKAREEVFAARREAASREAAVERIRGGGGAHGRPPSGLRPRRPGSGPDPPNPA